MVGYDNQADALTLGDNDELKVGDYEISYNSSNDQWQAEYTPTSDVSHVPKNQSGSLFPTDFADALDGKALADDGNLYDSVQTAENNATGFVFIGPGTFNESVNISTKGLTVQGSGYDSLIQGGTGHGVQVNASNVTIQSLRVESNGIDGLIALKVETDNSNVRIDSVHSSESGGDAINVDATDSIIRNCHVVNPPSRGIELNGDRSVASNNQIESVGTAFVEVTAQDCIFTENVGDTSLNNGIYVSNSDNIVIGNRIHNTSNFGVRIQSGSDTILANNRISGSDGISDSGTGTVLDDNLTGPSN